MSVLSRIAHWAIRIFYVAVILGCDCQAYSREIYQEEIDEALHAAGWTADGRFCFPVKAVHRFQYSATTQYTRADIHSILCLNADGRATIHYGLRYEDTGSMSIAELFDEYNIIDGCVGNNLNCSNAPPLTKATSYRTSIFDDVIYISVNDDVITNGLATSVSVVISVSSPWGNLKVPVDIAKVNLKNVGILLTNESRDRLYGNNIRPFIKYAPTPQIVRRENTSNISGDAKALLAKNATIGDFAAKPTLQASHDDPHRSAAHDSVLKEKPSGRRLALILANSSYDGQQWGAIPSVVQDAQEMEVVLREQRFEIFRVSRNQDRQAMDRTIAAFRAALETEPRPELALLYFSGHGTSIANRNYMVPVGARNPREFESLPLDSQDVTAQAEYVAVQDVFRTLQSGAHSTLMVIDACRDDATTKGTRQAWAKNAPAGVPAYTRQSIASGSSGIFYATEPGNISLAGPPGEPSPFTRILVKNLRGGTTSLMDVFVATIREAKQATGRKPWYDGDLTLLTEVHLRQR